eukprot:4129500-Amphidinium_carterae.1
MLWHDTPQNGALLLEVYRGLLHGEEVIAADNDSGQFHHVRMRDAGLSLYPKSRIGDHLATPL